MRPLLAGWLWAADRPDTLLGSSVFRLIAGQLDRIPLPRNEPFYRVKSATIERCKGMIRPADLASWETAMRAAPDRAVILAEGGRLTDVLWETVREWWYPLAIRSPEAAGDLLQFSVTIERLAATHYLLAVYHPDATTRPILDRVYRDLLTHQGAAAYVVYRHPTYFPQIQHDAWWTIVRENAAHRRIHPQRAVGRHLLSLFFAPAFATQLENAATAAALAWSYFAIVTQPLRVQGGAQEQHYRQILQRLAHYPAFRALRAAGTVAQQRAWHFPINRNFPFATCAHTIHLWRVPAFPLQLDAVVQAAWTPPAPEQATDYPTDYTETFVPADPATQAGLILAALLDSPAVRNAGGRYPAAVATALALVRTLLEGTTPGSSYVGWEPEVAFARWYADINAGMAARPTAATAAVLQQFRRELPGLFHQTGARFIQGFFVMSLTLLSLGRQAKLRAILQQEQAIYSDLQSLFAPTTPDLTGIASEPPRLLLGSPERGTGVPAFPAEVERQSMQIFMQVAEQIEYRLRRQHPDWSEDDLAIQLSTALHPPVVPLDQAIEELPPV
ncbi:MAG: hypothetical protein M3Z04_16180 [Chloroflexota bacterium]|nr:hypothetical protein [Chloroflexota bacterium]